MLESCMFEKHMWENRIKYFTGFDTISELISFKLFTKTYI